jgi:hypothetical protein
MTTDVRRPHGDEWPHQYFRQVFGREADSSEMDRYVIAWLITAMHGATAGQPALPSQADGGARPHSG